MTGRGDQRIGTMILLWMGILALVVLLANAFGAVGTKEPDPPVRPRVESTHHYSCAKGSRFSNTASSGGATISLRGDWHFQPCPQRPGYPFGFSIGIWFPERHNTLRAAIMDESHGDPVYCNTSAKWEELCGLVGNQLPTRRSR